MANYRPNYKNTTNSGIASRRFNSDDYYEWIRTKGMYSSHSWVYSLPGFHAWLQYKDAEKYRNDYRKNTGKIPAYVTFNRGYYRGSSAFSDYANLSSAGRLGGNMFSKSYEKLWM